MQYIDGKVLVLSVLKGLWVLWPMWAFLVALVIGKLAYRIYEMNRLSRSGVKDIDSMDGKTFEKYLEVLFRKLGYKVERTRYIGDYGADLVVKKDGIKTVIQAKRYKNNVGVKAIQEAVAAAGYYQCDAAMVVTNSFYTKQAQELARSNRVDLWDRNDLVKALLKVKKGGVAEPELGGSKTGEATESPVIESSDNYKCAVCGAVVSKKVQRYCLDHGDRFGGKTYCYQHQQEMKS